MLVIPSWYPPDGGHFFLHQSAAIHQSGYMVNLIYAAPTRNPLKDFLCSPTKQAALDALTPYPVHRGHYLSLRVNSRSTPDAYARKVIRIYESLRDQLPKIDIIHAHSAVWAGYAAAKLSGITKIPYIITEHRGRFTHASPQASKLMRKWYAPFLETAFSNAAHIIVVGSGLLKGIAPYLSEQATHSIISNPVQNCFFETTLKTKKALPFTFIFVGNPSPDKGMDLLLDAFAQVKKRQPQIKLIVVGTSKSVPFYRKQCRELCILSEVDFKGWLAPEDVAREQSQADVFVLPSRFEAQGVAYLEAMASGIPIIATEATPAEIRPSHLARTVAVDDLGDLTHTMLQSIENPLETPAAQIRAFARREFSQSSVIDKITAVYESVLSTI